MTYLEDNAASLSTLRRKFVQRDQQIRHTLTGCVTDRVGDGRSNATQNTVKLTTNLLDHGVADTLGLVGAIMPATLNCEFDAHFGVPRSTATGSSQFSSRLARWRWRLYLLCDVASLHGRPLDA